MKQEEFEAIQLYVCIIGLFLMGTIAAVAAHSMDNPIIALLTAILGPVSWSFGFAFRSNGYNRRFWNLFNVANSPSFEERKEALYGGDGS